MAYKINGVIRLADNGDANLGFVTATDVNAGTGSVTAAELYGKVSKEAITEQTEGDETNITGADEVLIYDKETDSLLRVTVDEFVVGSGIGTLVENFDHVQAGSLVVTGFSTFGSTGQTKISSSGEILLNSLSRIQFGNLDGTPTGLVIRHNSSTNTSEIVDVGSGDIQIQADTGKSVFIGNDDNLTALTVTGAGASISDDLYIVGSVTEVININASGIVTAPILEVGSINASGDDVTIGGGVTIGAGLTVGEDLKVFGNAEVSGIVSMSGGINISGNVEVSGIITSAPGGIVTYYGDHGNITNLSPASIVSTTEPTERLTGEPLQDGDLWFFSGAGDGQLRQYTYTQGSFKDSNPQVAIPPLTFDANTGGSSIGIASEVLSVKGVDNIETVAAGATITVGLSSNVSIAGSMTAVAYYGDGSFLTGLGTEGVSNVPIFPSDVTANNLTARNLSSTRNLYVTGVSTFEGPITGAANTTAALSVVANDDTKLIRANQASNTAEGVELYYADSLKFQTLSTGASVTGNMHADTFTGDGSGLTDVISTAEDVAIGSTSIETDPQYITFVEGQSGVHTVRTESRLYYTPNTGILSTPAVQSSFVRAQVGEDLTLDSGLGKQVLIQDTTSISGGLSVTGVTTAGIITASGSATFTDGVFLPDNSTLSIGSTAPFTINHDGTESLIRNTTGDLNIRVSDENQVAIQRDVTGTPIAEFNPQEDVKLYYNGGERLRTTPDGVFVSGALTATKFYGDASGLINAPINGIVTDLASDRYYAALGLDVGILTATDANIDNLVVNNDVVAGAFVGTGSSITDLDAGELTSGTIPTARFPDPLPTLDGSNLTNLNADELKSGIVTAARLSGTYNIDISGNAATATNATNSDSATNATAVSVTNVTDNVWRPVTFVDNTTAGNKTIRVDTGTEAAINPNTNQFRATSFLGNLTGNVTGNLSGDVTGNVSGNAGSVTNGVYTEGDQTINGTKTFTSTISGVINRAVRSDTSQIEHDTGNAWHRPVFVDADFSSDSYIQLRSDNEEVIGINPNLNQIRATTFVGNLSGTASNADTLDSIDSEGFLRSNANDVATGRIVYRAGNNQSANTASGSLGSIEINQQTAGKDAFMSLHISNDYATYFGLDGATNDLFVGGWSKGAVKYKIWHAGNDGSGSGLDADTLRTRAPSVSVSNNSIVERDGGGRIFAEDIALNTGTTASISGGIAYRIASTDSGSNENRLRFCTSAGSIRTFIGSPANNGTGATGTWGISITGSADSIEVESTTADIWYRPLFAGGTGNSEQVRADSDATIGINPSRNEVRATRFIGALTGDVTGNVSGSAGSASVATSADESDRSLIQHDTGNAWHRIVMVDDGLSNNSQTILKSDNASTIGINPSTNTIRATTFDGNLSGQASSVNGGGTFNGTLSNSSFRDAQVQLPHGSRGVYVFAGASLNGTTSGNSTTSGGNLRDSNAAGENSSSSRGGTWRLMGYLGGGTPDFVENKTSLWLRIS